MLNYLHRHSYYYELPLAYLALFGINHYLLPEYHGFIGIEPHPYWAIIFLFSYRYGILTGFLSGLIATCLYLEFAWNSVDRYLFEDPSFYFLPASFIFVGILVGAGVNRYRKQIGVLEQDREKLFSKIDEFKDEIKTVHEINLGLEKRIVTKITTLVTLYEGARQLESNQIEHLYQSIFDFISKTLDLEEAALYLKGEDGWCLTKKRGWKEYVERPQNIPYSEGIIGIAGSGNKIVSIRDFIHQSDQKQALPKLLGDTILAGPICKGENGEVLAVFAVQSMSFTNFNSATLNLFSFLLQWVSRAMGRACYVNELKKKEVIDPEYPVYSHGYFLSRANQEFLRSKTYYLPLEVALVQIKGLNALSPRQRDLTMMALSQLLKESVRDMDVVARYGEPDIPFAILLITAGKEESARLTSRIISNFSKLKMDSLMLSLGVASFAPKTEDFNAMIVDAKKGLKL